MPRANTPHPTPDSTHARRAPSPYLFLALALLTTWAGWGLLAATRLPPTSIPGLILLAIGGCGPAAVAIAFLYTRHTKAHQHDFWRRIIDLKRPSPRWWLITLALPPAILLAAWILGVTTINAGLTWDTAAQRLIQQPWTLAPLLLFALLFGPLPEEIAWRGYALDPLQQRHTALTASLILGTVWALWHLPLFLIEGTYQHEKGIATPAFWLYTIDVLPKAVLLTWIYNHTNRSTAAAIAFHTSINLVGLFTTRSDALELFHVALWFVAAGAVVALCGPATLRRNHP